MDTLIQKEYPYLYMHIKHCTLSGDDRHICHSNNYQTELDSNKLVIELNAFLGWSPWGRVWQAWFCACEMSRRFVYTSDLYGFGCYWFMGEFSWKGLISFWMNSLG